MSPKSMTRELDYFPIALVSDSTWQDGEGVSLGSRVDPESSPPVATCPLRCFRNEKSQLVECTRIHFDFV